MSLHPSRHPVTLPQKLKLKKKYIFVSFYYTFSKFQSDDFSGNVKSCHRRVYQNLCVFKSSLWKEPQPDSPPPPWVCQPTGYDRNGMKPDQHCQRLAIEEEEKEEEEEGDN